MHLIYEMNIHTQLVGHYSSGAKFHTKSWLEITRYWFTT